jgi:hypothetical protein
MAEIGEESKAAPAGPPAIIHFTFEGKQERAVEISFDVKSEGWSTYILEDGTVIKMKTVTSRVMKLLDRVREDGSPFYVLEGVAVVTTIKPESPSNQEREQNA